MAKKSRRNSRRKSSRSSRKRRRAISFRALITTLAFVLVALGVVTAALHRVQRLDAGRDVVDLAIEHLPIDLEPGGGDRTDAATGYDDVDSPPTSPTVAPDATRRAVDVPELAIVLDDLGYDWGLAAEAMKRIPEVALAVLPHLHYSERIAREAQFRGILVMVHMPMEPHDYPGVDPGPGALLLDMTPPDVTTELNSALESIPHARGLNNHMGSAFTENRVALRPVMEILRDRKMFFLDSRTSAQSAAFDAARQAGVPAARRNVFLDNVDDVDEILARLMESAEIAKRDGGAVSIGHIRQNTIIAIEKFRETESAGEIQLVPVTRLLVQ